MSWGAVQAIAAIASGILSFGSVLFFAGKFAQQLRDTRDDVAAHDEKLDIHAEKLNAHEVKLAVMESWKEGFNAATRASHETQN